MDINLELTKERTMYPAPFKLSDPTGAEMPKKIDKNRLGRENWTLGASPMRYETVHQTNFGRDKGGQSLDRKAQAAAIYALKSKVGGTSIRNEVSNSAELGAIW